MRIIGVIVACAALAFTSSEAAFATTVSKEKAEKICNGKPALPGGGCNWCGIKVCTSVNCDEEGCDVTIIGTGNKELTTPPLTPPKAGNIGVATPPVGNIQ
jgi:hypothetical protein